MDVKPGGTGCETVWTSGAFAVHRGQGLRPGRAAVPLHQGASQDLLDAWYLTAVDVHTGRTVYKVLTGMGKWFDNNWAPINIGPDGSAYVGVVGGLVAVRDRE